MLFGAFRRPVFGLLLFGRHCLTAIPSPGQKLIEEAMVGVKYYLLRRDPLKPTTNRLQERAPARQCLGGQRGRPFHGNAGHTRGTP